MNMMSAPSMIAPERLLVICSESRWETSNALLEIGVPILDPICARAWRRSALASSADVAWSQDTFALSDCRRQHVGLRGVGVVAADRRRKSDVHSPRLAQGAITRHYARHLKLLQSRN